MTTFLNGIKINLDKLPVHKQFSMDWEEPVDYNILQQLVTNTEDWNKPEIRSLVENCILSVINKSTGVLTTKHYQNFQKHGKGYGRFYPSNYGSLSVMPRHYKHTVYSLLGWRDLDMRSAHPNIVFETFKNNGEILTAYAEYLQNKDQITKDLLQWYDDPDNPVLEEEDIKYLFNLTTFGGGISTWIDKIENEPWTLLNGIPDPNWKPRKIFNHEPHPFYTRYKKDTETARDKICQANTKLLEIALESRESKDQEFSRYDVETTTMSLYCSIIENEILYIAYKFLLFKNVMQPRKGGLEMDGLNVPPPRCGWENVDCEALLVGLNEKVKHDTKIGIKFVWKGYKPENIHLTLDQIVRQPLTEIELKKEGPNGVKNDMEAAQRVFELHPHWVCCENELFVFSPDTGMWDNSTTTHREIIAKHCKDLYVLHEIKDGFKVSNTKSYGNTLTLMDKIPPLIRTMCVNNNWIKSTQYSSLGKILFLNGYYDFHKSRFYSKEKYGFNPEIVFMAKIHHDFEMLSREDMEYMEDVKQRLFYNSLGKEVGDYTILQLARGLAGDMMKRILFGLGATNTGKGVLTTALMLSCGEYIGSFNAENLAYRQTSNDEAQIMRWAMLLRFKRIIISNEIKNTVELNGNMIKKIASGGDPLIGRNHGGKETEFITHFLPVVLANDLPNIKPYDDAVDSRVRVIGYNKNYVDEPSNSFELKRDDNIKHELKELRFQRIFVWLLITAYVEFLENGEPVEPVAVLKAKEKWVAQDKSVIETFKKTYEITNNPNDCELSNNIEAWIKSENLGISMKKFGAELSRYCDIHGFDEVFSKDKKVYGQTKKAWFGVRTIPETPDIRIAITGDEEYDYSND